MKYITRILFVKLFAISFSTFSVAQFNSVGIKGGLNLSQLDYKSDLQAYDFSYRTGFNGGIFFEIDLSNLFLIHTEVAYTRRGTEYGLENYSIFGMHVPDHKFTQTLDYIEIPVIFHYKLPVNFTLIPKLFIGPEIAFLLSSKTAYEEEGKFIGEIDVTDIESLEFGIVFGIGTEYKFATVKLIFDIRYNFGISNINKISSQSKITSSTISFNIGYGFNL